MGASIKDNVPSQAGWVLLTRHLRDPWSVTRLAKELAVSSRTLHRAFLRDHGMAPMAMLRSIRLQAARNLLETASSGTTVTMVALDCGFAHLGRFSLEYARRFGESPSETLRQARSRYRPPAPDGPSVAAQYALTHAEHA